VIDRLMCDGQVDLGRIGGEHGIDAPAYFARELQALGALGDLATYDGDARIVRTSAHGRLLVRNVCMVFDRYQAAATQADPAPAGDSPEDRPRFSPTI
jgi:oxygen-independent coproporphyrinogen-3 oxidase